MMRERKIVKHVPFEERTVELELNHTTPGGKKKKLTNRTNQFTADFITNRYVVLRDFVPKDIITFALDTWKTVEHNPEWLDIILKHEKTDITNNSPKESIGKSTGGYCSPWGVALNRFLKDKLKRVLDFELGETYSYTRKYERGAYLSAHRDRPACEISTTLCLGYKTDDGKPWRIWVDNSRNWVDNDDIAFLQSETQKVPNRLRTSVPIDLEVGDVLLYQGPNAAHWRDYLVGDYSYHIFSHFYNREGRIPIGHPKSVWRGEDENTHKPHFRDGFIPSAGRYDPPCVLEYDGRLSRYHMQMDRPIELEEAYNKFVESYETCEYGLRSEWANRMED